MSHAPNSTKAVLYALGANFGIAVAKAAAAWLTNSGAMFAEAIHSAADCANQGLLILGMKRAQRPVSEEHPLGYGKAVYFWSFIVALLLFSMGGMVSIYEGIHKLQHPEMPRSAWVAVTVLAVSVLLEVVSLRGALVEVKKVQGDKNLIRWFRSSRQSELIVVVAEDIAALLGLVMALAAVVATIVTQNPLFDALGTISIGVVLILIAVTVGIEVKSLLIGESADPDTVSAMKAFIAGRPEVGQVYSLITLQLGSELMVSVKAGMKTRGSALDLVTDINRVERDFRDAFPQARWIFFEPDIQD